MYYPTLIEEYRLLVNMNVLVREDKYRYVYKVLVFTSRMTYNL